MSSKLDPRRLLYILHLPIRLIRIVTDPIVDSCMFLLTRVVVPPMLNLIQVSFVMVTRMLASLIGQEGSTRGVLLTTNLVRSLPCHFEVSRIDDSNSTIALWK